MLVPKVAKYFDTLPSTNAALLGALEAGEPLAEGSVYLTRSQTAGRGQGSNQWHATPGDNVTLSMVLRPEHLSVDRLFALNALVSLAVSATLHHFLPPHLAGAVRIKWPNDVYVGRSKIAGILIHNALRGMRVQWAVVGVGLNVNETAFPAELDERATSLAQLLHEAISLEDVTHYLFTQLAEYYPLLQPDRLDELHRSYTAQLYLLEELTSFTLRDTNEPFNAYVAGVSVDGKLLLRHPHGQTERYDMRSVVWHYP